MLYTILHTTYYILHTTYYILWCILYYILYSLLYTIQSNGCENSDEKLPLLLEFAMEILPIIPYRSCLLIYGITIVRLLSF